MKRTLFNAATALAIFCGLLLVWQAVIWLFDIQPYLLPSPIRVAHASGDELSRADDLPYDYGLLRPLAGWLVRWS